MSGGVPFRPADLARGHSSPPPEVPREMALVRKTSRQGYFRQRSATQPGVTAAKMLGTMHEDRPSIRDAGADTVCAFDPLGPDAAQPYTPLPELLVLALVAAMVDSDSIAVAQENYVRLRANNGIEAVYLFLGLG